MNKIRIYADTSIFGGVYDKEFETPSKILFNQIKKQQFILVTSALVQAEIEPAPDKIKQLFDEMLAFAEIAQISEAALELQNAYLTTGIVSQKYANDALHVALATTSNCTLIVSWNFKHIVHFQKIPLYNAINLVNGYPQINIFSPLEVINYDNE